MGLTERHLFENEDVPENYEWALEDAVYNSCTNKNYQSPIEVIQTQMRNQIEGEIFKAVINVGVNVDKEELLKALQYDREQYQKGYKDRDDQIIRCKDCIHNGKVEKCVLAAIAAEKDFPLFMLDNHGEWFCADGKQKGTTTDE